MSQTPPTRALGPLGARRAIAVGRAEPAGRAGQVHRTDRANPANPASRSRRWRVSLAGLLIGLVTTIALGVGGTALALYSQQAVFNLGTIRAGDLNVTLGQLSWHQVTPGVSPGAVGTATTAPDGFRSMPGDVIEIRVPATVVLKGDNLVADLTVDYQPGSSEAIAATYHVNDPSGAQVAPASGEAAVGTAVTLRDLLGGGAGVNAQYSIVITVKVLGDYRWVTPATQDGATPWNAGTVSAELKQVRPGGGA